MEELGQYSLEAPSGARIALCAFGASLREVLMPDRHGTFANVALTPSSWDGSYAGAVLAPYAGRIPNGILPLNGHMLAMTRNEGQHQLHGGPNNLSAVPWDAQAIQMGKDWQSLCFTTEAEDGRDGYPGNRLFSITYRLWSHHRLDIVLEAITDRATRVNLSHHAYWNLSGDFSRHALAQCLRINADEVYVNADDNIALRRESVCGTAFDFRNTRDLLSARTNREPQLQIAKGYNHAFALRQRRASTDAAAELCDPQSGRRMTLFTDQPALRVYSGGYLNVPSCAIALEAEEWPIAPAPCPPPDTLLLPGIPYRRHISFCFDAV